jgi:hypothetical protein
MGLFHKHIIQCTICHKEVNAKIIKKWHRVKHFECPSDKQCFPTCTHLMGDFKIEYNRVLTLHHTEGRIFNRHRCKGSGKTTVIESEIKPNS